MKKQQPPPNKQPQKPEPHMYMMLGLSIGMCFGVAFGVIFDNIATGIPIGMCLGLGIGSLIDYNISNQNKAAVIKHYDSLIDENNDPVHDPEPLRKYMNKWDGQAFIDELELTAEKSVLEIGVGTGRLAVRVCGKCKSFTGIDISPKTIERAKENLKEFDNTILLCGDFMEYKFSETFDLIYSSLTFMHILDKQTAISKVNTLLKSGGRFILSISKNGDTLIEMNGRKVEIYPDTPDEIIKIIKHAKLNLNHQFETEFAYVFIAARE